MKRKQRICKYPRCYAVYTASAEAQATSWGGGADNFADWYNTWKDGARAAIALAKLYPNEEVMMLTFVDGEAEDHPSYYKWNETKKCVESYTHEAREILNGNC